MSDDSPKSGQLQKYSSQTGLSRRAPDTAIAPTSPEEDEYLSVARELEELEKREAAAGRSQKSPDAATGFPYWERLLMAALHLIGGLVGFALLLRISELGAVFWFLFLLTAYPITLAFGARANTLGRHDLLQLYKVGVAQIPAIGKFLSQLFPDGVKKKDDL